MTIPNVKVLSDIQIRTTSNTTVLGTAQSKGTATDLLLTIMAGTDGVNPVAGTVIPVVFGSNVTTAASFTNSVSPDKGTLANITAGGQQVLHFAQLQFQFYALRVSAGASTTCDTSAHWGFYNIQDSFDNTQQ